MEMLRNFSKLGKDDLSLVGGKGVSLGEMVRVGIPVPPGFVILTSAFEKFLKQTALNVEIDSILNSVSHKKIHTVENAKEKIQALILGAKMPKDIANAIQKFFKKFGADYVAIRSSASAEDSLSAAWAGQLESYLNTTEEDLLENVKKCWASLFTPHAIFYRFEKNLRKQKISVAVVVQKMVESEKSGIAFSVHPITQDRNQLIIEAGFGLGEAVASGQITPDSYVVEKQPRRIIDKNIQIQTRGLYRAEGGGNEWRDIPKERGNRQVLSDREILELTKIILRIENYYRFPCDIEWAFEKGKFYVVQSRPITSLCNKTANSQNLIGYIKSQKWFLGVRADESLLLYSAKRSEYDAYIKKEYGIGFAETLLIPLRRDYPVRVFNLWQAKNFHAISNEKILKRPKILSSYARKDIILYREIEAQGKKLLFAIKRDAYRDSIKFFKKILSLYEIASAHFTIIFSLGLKLAENRSSLKKNINTINDIVKKHDRWRNTVAFYEEAMDEKIFSFFKYLAARKKMRIDPSSLMKFLTRDEVELWLDEQFPDAEVTKRVKTRKNHGWIYLNLKNKSREMVDNPAEVKEIQRYFLELDKESHELKNRDKIKGQVAYRFKKSIKGKALLIKDRYELKNKYCFIGNKILVAMQTTPHFIPYLKKAKAIITDEGGLTCHAAILARELKIPCIVGTKIATQILKDGDFVEVNMESGVIEIKKS